MIILRKIMGNQSWENLSRSERRLEMLASYVSGGTASGNSLMEKPTSIRLNQYTYPCVKALSNLSNTSMNLIINDMIEVAYASLVEKLSDDDFNVLQSHVTAILNNWVKEEEANATDNG